MNSKAKQTPPRTNKRPRTRKTRSKSKKLRKWQKLSLTDDCSSSNNNNAPQGMLQCKTTVSDNSVFMHFNMHATQIELVEEKFSSENCHCFFHPIKMETFSLGVFLLNLKVHNELELWRGFATKCVKDCSWEKCAI